MIVCFIVFRCLICYYNSKINIIMCKTLAKAQYFAIINVQSDYSYLDNIDAVADRHKSYQKDYPARLE